MPFFFCFRILHFGYFCGETKKYVVCGFVKSASVISVRLNGAKQTVAARGPKPETDPNAAKPTKAPAKKNKINKDPFLHVGSA